MSKSLSLGLPSSHWAGVSATVDEMTCNEPVAGIGESSVVILGIPHAPDYDTEFDFIECIGDHIHSGDPGIEVINEIAFINEFISVRALHCTNAAHKPLTGSCNCRLWRTGLPR